MDRQTRMYDNFDKVEQKTIKEMCAIYPQLEKDILPQLRRAEVYVNETYKDVVSRTIKVKVEKK